VALDLLSAGTGASAVYALLGYKKFGWKFLATETDITCYESALNNVLINGLTENIAVKYVKTDGQKLIGNLGWCLLI
jgi:23S rRNA A1618 N6-methylase RlmF